MKNPLLTVYITNYNYGRYIKQAIESVLHQTFQDFELLIIDDGSTDGSKEIIEPYDLNPVIDVIYQQNKGLNITNNIALRLAKGKYIMRLDADDYLTSDALEKMIGLLEADEELGMVFPDYYLVDAQNNVLAEVKRHNFKEEVGLFDQPAHGACTVIRKEFLDSVGGYDESYSCQDGYELWIKFIAKYKVTNIRESLFYYRRHGENLTANENRILGTRRSINGNFIKNNEIKVPNTIAVVPIRGVNVGRELLSFTELGGEKVIDIKIKSLLQSQLLDKIIITSSTPEIKNYILKNYSGEKRVVFIDRPKDLARYNVSLVGTIEYILEQPSIQLLNVGAFMILPIEYIFLTGEVIDDAINALEIFKADSLISVRQEYASFYQHHGNGMTPILEQANNYTHLEREALFKAAGGIQLTRVSSFKKEKKIQAGKVGHIVVDQRTAMGIFSDFDLQVANLILEREKSLIK